ncbi:MAG: hypothetical protein ACRD3N_09350 [Terracidiphilus sp.]
MHSGHATSETWRPETRDDREAILRELNEVLASAHFCNSKRYPALLKYVVEHTLNGNAEMLKERTLGVEVFGRPADYDTNADTVVRFTASEVRKRLLLYYSELDRSSDVRISLPSGSYIPEFFHGHDRPHGHLGEGAGLAEAHLGQASSVYVHTRPDGDGIEPSRLPPQGVSNGELPRAAASTPERPRGVRRRILWRSAIAVAVLAALAGSWLIYRSLSPQSALKSFWSPVLQGQSSILICTGSVVFTPQSNYSGVITAGRDIDYTFVSMQIASAINEVNLTVDHSGGASQLIPSATTPLTGLRDHSVILLGGYNNQWTMRLLAPLRFHFAPAPDEAIVDQMQPQTQWRRDTSLPYSSADDYAIVARFRDPTIDGWVVALAGLGRNGTEAAALFTTDPRYMQMLRSWMGRDFGGRNIEAVLKVNVIDGKTGAPSILAVHVW